MDRKKTQIIIDLDNTITVDQKSKDYSEKAPNSDVVKTLKNFSAEQITILTARNMRTYQGNLDSIHKHTKPIAEKWLNENGVNYGSIVFGKPWCKQEGHYVDDKNISIEEFVFKFGGPYSQLTVDIVIPFYNEEENILRSYREHKKLERLFNIRKYIFVDNGSSASSQKFFDEVIDLDEKIDVIRIEENIGYGNGMIVGLKSSKAELILTNHADGQFDAYSFFYQHREFLSNSNILSIFPVRLNRPLKDSLFSSILRLILSVITLKRTADFNGQPKLLVRDELPKNIQDYPKDFSFDYLLWKSQINQHNLPILQKPRSFGFSTWQGQMMKRIMIFLSYINTSLRGI